MAKRRSNKNRSYRQSGRDAVVIATPKRRDRLGVPGLNIKKFKPRLPFPDVMSYARFVEDNRRWSPEGIRRTIRRVNGAPASTNVSFAHPRRDVLPSKVPSFHVPHTIAFRSPPSVLVCIRRAIRRRIIHSLGVAGGRVAKPKLNWTSSISCRG